MAAKISYFRATRHPWPSFLFLVPLLLAYEGGILWLGGPHPEALYNGAHAWIRWALVTVGLQTAYWPPILISLIFLFWTYVRWSDRPQDTVGVVTGIAIEAVLFALGLWGISKGMDPLLDRLGVKLSWSPATKDAIGQTITFLGAGIYEEVLFRLVLFTALTVLLRLAFVPGLLAVPVAAVGSALLFSAAHHYGTSGEAFKAGVFLFRTVAGLYFTIVYRVRGFGVAAGAHALYDVVVGVSLV